MSEAAKHTPGPWQISGVSMNDGSISIRHAEHRIVIAYATNAASLGDFVFAAMNGRRDFGASDTAVTQWANAKLIAAAPDLFDVVKRGRQKLATYVSVYPGDKELRGLLAAWDAAISRAESTLPADRKE